MVSFSPYPADPRARRVAETLLKEGMRVDILCLADGESAKHETSDGLNIRRLSIEHRRGGLLSYAYQYSAFILSTAVILGLRSLRRRYDLAYIHNMPDILILSALLPKLMGARVILDQHDPMPELMTTIFKLDKRSIGVRVMEWLERWSIARANSVITVNVACKRIFSSRSCPPEKIGVVMNAPDDEIFRFQAGCLRLSRYNVATRRFVIMYHGSMVPRNGLDLAIDALDRVRQSVPGVELRIYGRSTPFLERVMDGVRARGLENCVHYLGARSLEELVPEIEDCDLGVIPNHRSAFSEINTPTRIFEYLALGKPVIAPRSSGICDYFDDRSLVFFELGSPEDLAVRIKYVISHPTDVMDIVRRGQEVYRQHNWATERHRLTELVYWLLCEPCR
jgi:glycosyltransferase involved in cell wall biosynthesis